MIATKPPMRVRQKPPTRGAHPIANFNDIANGRTTRVTLESLKKGVEAKNARWARKESTLQVSFNGASHNFTISGNCVNFDPDDIDFIKDYVI